MEKEMNTADEIIALVGKMEDNADKLCRQSVKYRTEIAEKLERRFCDE